MARLVTLLRYLMTWLYRLLRRHGTKNRVCFFSRQGDEPSKDFLELREALRQRAPEVEIRTICCRYRDRRDNTLRFILACVHSIFLVARARVCVLDTYWPTVCMLQDKGDLTVVQIWHSVGKIKRSGYQTVGMPTGRSERAAQLLCMHQNYDYIIAGGEVWDPAYCACFRTSVDQLVHCGLPRLDALVKNSENRALRQQYPELCDRPVVLYVPTYRHYPFRLSPELEKTLTERGYLLICRYHQNQVTEDHLPLPVPYPELTTFELMQCCDYVVTDYSSLALEAAGMNKKLLYYLPDYARYREKNGLNMDPMRVMPDCTATDGEKLLWLLQRPYPWQKLQEYRDRYLPPEMGHATEKITDLILDGLGCEKNALYRDGGRADASLACGQSNTEASGAHRSGDHAVAAGASGTQHGEEQ